MNSRRIKLAARCGMATALLFGCSSGSSSSTGDAGTDAPVFNPGFDAGPVADGSHPLADVVTTGMDTGPHADVVVTHMDAHGGQDVATGHDTGTQADTGGGGHDSGGSGFPPGTICNKSGTKLTPPPLVKHVIVIMEENEDFGSVNGNANAPYITSLAADCGYASNYADNIFVENLVSNPHYLALASGSNCNTGVDESGTGCITTDGDSSGQTLNTTSIFAQVSSWKAYEESMPSNCATSTSGLYAPKHNPASYFSTLSSCSTNDIPIAAVVCSSTTHMSSCGTPSNAFTDDLANDTLPAFAYVTPNLDNDMHNSTGAVGVTKGDNWLYTYMPLILASKAYLAGEVAIFVLWDEQGSGFGSSTPNFFVSPYITAGTVVSATVNHFAALRAIESSLGITTYLGCASGSITGGGSCAAGSTADLRTLFNF